MPLTHGCQKNGVPFLGVNILVDPRLFLCELCLSACVSFPAEAQEVVGRADHSDRQLVRTRRVGRQHERAAVHAAHRLGASLAPAVAARDVQPGGQTILKQAYLVHVINTTREVRVQPPPELLHRRSGDRQVGVTGLPVHGNAANVMTPQNAAHVAVAGLTAENGELGGDHACGLL